MLPYGNMLVLWVCKYLSAFFFILPSRSHPLLCSRNQWLSSRGRQGFRGIERAELDVVWRDKVYELKRGGHEIKATEHALDGALSIM